MKPWTIAHLDKLKAEGKIRSYSVQTLKKEVQDANGKIITKAFAKRSKEKEFIEEHLVWFCNAKGYKLVQEYKFHPERRWRFDYAIPSLMTAVEYEGGIFNPNGDHRSIKGISRDVEKYNAAAAMGWRVIRLTAINYKSLLTELNAIK